MEILVDEKYPEKLGHTTSARFLCENVLLDEKVWNSLEANQQVRFGSKVILPDPSSLCYLLM